MTTFLKKHACRLQAPVIALLAAWIYWPALSGGWLWDDAADFTPKADAPGPPGPWNVGFEPGMRAAYDPVKAAVEWVQWHLWGGGTPGYHCTNLALHIGGAVLVGWLLRKLGLKFAWLGGLIFAAHPALVESVARIAGLKQTLSLPLFLLAMGFWLNYEQRRRRRDYLLSLGFFLAAMLAEPVPVMFPAVILLYAWWKRGRIGWGEVKAAAPFFLVSLALGLAALDLGAGFQARHRLGIDPPVPGGFLSWLALSGSSLEFYVSKAVLPVGLMPIYPRWPVDPPSPADFLPWAALAGLVFCCWHMRRTWGRHILLGVGFFVITLAPFVLLHAGGYTGFTWVMDSALYLPIIGLIGLLVAGIERLETGLPLPIRVVGTALVGVCLGWMTWQSHVQAATYADEETFWTYALDKNPEAWPAQGHLGNLLLRQGRVVEAAGHLEEAVKVNPNFAPSRNDLGSALLRQERISEAIGQFQAALKLVPGYALAQANWGLALARAGQIPDAIGHDQEALRIDPDCVEAHDAWAAALVQSGQFEEAIAQDQDAVQLKPDDTAAQINWGFALAQMGRPWEAMGHDEEALRWQPGLAEAQSDWGDDLMKAGQAEDAAAHYREALRIKPDDAGFQDKLGNALAAAGSTAEAVARYQEALRLDPGSVAAHNHWGEFLLRQGRAPEAIGHFQEALKIRPNDAEAQTDWGNALASQTNTAEAIVHYQAAVQANPDFAAAQVGWADLLFHAGSVEEAIPHYLEAVRIEPANAEARAKAGTALAADGQNSEALEQFEAALRLDPGAGLHDSAGLALLKLGRKPEALEHFQAALKLNPSDAVARTNLGQPVPPAANASGQR